MSGRVTAERPPASRWPTRSPASAFRVRHFGLVWLSGLIWHLTRWGVAFLGTFLVNELTGSPRLVQLAGTALYAPLLVGGVLGGLVSDRVDRLVTVRTQLAVLIPASIAIGILVRADRAPLWALYLYLFVVGVGWVTDMTSRRALVFDLVGESRIDNAMAFESLSLSSGMVLGALAGGSAVEAVGVGSAFFVIAGLLVVSLLVLGPVRSPPKLQSATVEATDDGLLDGIRQLRRQQSVFAILGVTVIANFFLFAYFPIVPVVADELGATPLLVGLLSAGTGIGMMSGSLVMARLRPRRRGLVYTIGVAMALVLLVPFALAPTYPLALTAIIVSGFGAGLFGSTQTTLVMAAAPAELRGRALGLLSMAIGALPLGMYVLGESAERIGVAAALIVNAVLGAVALASWTARRPQVVAMTGPADPADDERDPAAM
ncbi:MAG: MFS transporter [Actinomycetota bacterium]